MDVSITLESTPSNGNPVNISGNGIETYLSYIKIDNNSPDDPNRVYVIFDGNKFVVYTDEVLPQPKTSSPKKYSLSKGATKNGAFELTRTRATKGTKVTIVLYPNKGFTAETITVTDSDGNELEVTKVSKNEYEFTMPKGNINVDVTFMEDNSMLNFCTDVKADDISYDAIKWAYENNVTKGIDEVTFGKELTVTRGQVVTFLHRAVGTPEVSERSEIAFSDVDENEYYGDAVKWAVDNKITFGTGDNKFEPNKTCTLQETAILINRCTNGGGNIDATTEEANAYYNELIKQILDGHDKTLKEMKKEIGEDCTREDAAMLLYSCFGNEEK